MISRSALEALYIQKLTGFGPPCLCKPAEQGRPVVTAQCNHQSPSRRRFRVGAGLPNRHLDRAGNGLATASGHAHPPVGLRRSCLARWCIACIKQHGNTGEKMFHDRALTFGTRRTWSRVLAGCGPLTAPVPAPAACPPGQSRRRPTAGRWRNTAATVRQIGPAPAA